MEQTRGAESNLAFGVEASPEAVRFEEEIAGDREPKPF
jgi:hypothetical protein